MSQNSSNHTSSILSQSENVAAAFIIIFIDMVSLLGNGLVLLSFYICPKLRRQPGNWFLFSLASSDFMCSFYIQIPAIANLANPDWRFKDGLCTFHAVISWTIMTASNWMLAAVSTDRAIAVKRPLQYRAIVTTFKVRCIVIAVWMFSLIFSVSLIYKATTTFYSTELMCSPKWTPDDAVKGYFAAIFCFYVPSAILLSSNIYIIYTVRHLKMVMSPHVPRANEEDTPQFNVNDHTKTLRSLYVLVLVYFLCVAPYFIAKFSFLTREDGLLPESMFVLTIILMFLASALNAFIYSILRKDYKEGILKTIHILYEKVNTMRLKVLKRVLPNQPADEN